jgi:hypothetical protein
MSSSHKICPICEGQFDSNQHINEPCRELDKLSMTYTTDHCGGFYSPKKSEEFIRHIFWQISSFEQLFYYGVQFPLIVLGGGVNIEVNYVMWETVITYLNQDDERDERIVVPQKLFEVDFPLCNKTINKIKTLSPFL